MDNLEELTKSIKNNKHYKGQIYKGFHFSSKDRKPYDLDEIIGVKEKKLIQKLMEKTGLESLSYHQGKLLEDILIGKSVCASLPFGSDIERAIILTLSLFSISTGKTCLVLCENEKKAKKFEKLFPEKILEVVKISGMESESFSINITTDIVISTDRHLKYLLLTDFKKVENWLSSLGLVVVLELTSFNTVRTIHLKAIRKMFTMLGSDAQTIQYLITTEPINNSFELMKDLTGNTEGKEISIISDDCSEKNSFDLLYWIPPYVIDIKHKNENLVRNNFYNELGLLLSILEEREKVLIWHSFASVSHDRVAKYLKKYNFHGELKIVSSLDDISYDEYKTFDSAVLLGVPRNPAFLPSILGNILKNDSVVGIILPDDPISYYVIRSEKSFNEFSLPEILICSENVYINSYYFILHLYLSEITKISYERIKEYPFEDMDTIVNELKKKKILFDIDKDTFDIDREKIKTELGKNVFEAFTDKVVPVDYKNVKREVDAAYFPEKYFHGAVHYIDQLPYQMVMEDKKYRFTSFGEIAPVKRIPLLTHRIDDENNLKSQKGTFHISLSKAKLKISLDGYKEIESYDQTPADTEIIQFDRSEEYFKNTYIINISIENIPHEVFHLLKIWIPFIYKNFDDLYGIYFDEKNIVIYSFFPTKKESENLFLNLTTLLKAILNYGKESLLYCCPCRYGCTYCIDTLECYSQDSNLKKKATLDFINNKLNASIDLTVQYKYEGFGHKTAQKYYEETARKVFVVLETKLDLFIKNKATLAAVKESDLSPGVIGTFKGDQVHIIESLPEDKATEVIAHEYAHNWDSENSTRFHNLPPEVQDDKELTKITRKLIIEGFAQWAAFKVMDYYGLTSSMSGIYHWPFDEYGEGFRVLYWLEEELGFQAVITFVKTGQVDTPDGEIWGFEEILEKSGFKARVIQFILDKKRNKK